MTAGRENKSTNKQWLTPPDFLEDVRAVLGQIELDPSGSEGSFVNAIRNIILPEDGLLVDWKLYQTIFLNPPYGRDSNRGTTIKDWLRKASEAAVVGSEIIALIPVATNTTHWKEYVFPSCSRICFLQDSRFKFIGAGHKGAPMAVCAVYWGSKPELFEQVFSKRGAIR